MYRNFKYHDTHVEGAKVIAEACKDAGVEKLMHFSALGADPQSASRFLQSKVLINLSRFYAYVQRVSNATRCVSSNNFVEPIRFTYMYTCTI